VRTDTREQLERRILIELESTAPITQRSIASELGIAVGLNNLLMRRLVKKGWIQVKRVSARRIRYQITPAGMLAKARLSRQYFLASLSFYRECRERVRERLAAAAAGLVQRGGADARKDIVFYGAGEVAEVAYVCLQETPLALVGIVDPAVTRTFFGLPVLPPTELSHATLGGKPFALLIVMPSQDEEQVRRVLAAQGVAPERVFWL
jgi:DNA-binding MarR family transcriptional regulator